jgi:hypothetical protein
MRSRFVSTQLATLTTQPSPLRATCVEKSAFNGGSNPIQRPETRDTAAAAAAMVAPAAAICTAKAEGDAAFRAGRLEEAVEAYTRSLRDGADVDPGTLINRSLAALKLGHAAAALVDADRALAAAPPAALRAKAFHRRAAAQAALGQRVEALRTYRAGLAACAGAPELRAAARAALGAMPPAWLAAYLAPLAAAAQAPHPLSRRDGRLLRRVPEERRLEGGALAARLGAALASSARAAAEAAKLVAAGWAAGPGCRRPADAARAEAAYLRGLAHLAAGDAEQAARDAQVALVYGPRAPRPAAPRVPGADAPGAPPPPADAPAWAAALALAGTAAEARGDNVPAALAAARAARLEPACAEHAAALERLLRRMPEAYARILSTLGPEALEAALAAEREAARPEFLRRRPKYYYYFEWARKRLAARHPDLPEEVVDKFLSMDASELDLLLQFPGATDAAAARLTGVLAQRGAAALEAEPVPLLSWKEVRDLREAAAAGGAAALEAAPARPALEGGDAGTEGAKEAACDAGAGAECAGSENDDAGSVSVAELELPESLFELD